MQGVAGRDAREPRDDAVAEARAFCYDGGEVGERREGCEGGERRRGEGHVRGEFGSQAREDGGVGQDVVGRGAEVVRGRGGAGEQDGGCFCGEAGVG